MNVEAKEDSKILIYQLRQMWGRHQQEGLCFKSIKMHFAERGINASKLTEIRVVVFTGL